MFYTDVFRASRSVGAIIMFPVLAWILFFDVLFRVIELGCLFHANKHTAYFVLDGLSSGFTETYRRDRQEYCAISHCGSCVLSVFV